MELPVLQGSGTQILTHCFMQHTLIKFIAMLQTKFIQIKDVLLNFTSCTSVDHKCSWYYEQDLVA